MDLWFWLFMGPWIVFGAWWLIRALSTAKTISIESVGSRLTYRVAMLAGAVVLVVGSHYDLGPLSRRLWPPSLSLAVIGVVLTCVGVGFAIWARETLGRYWSGTITLKEGHRVIKTGPYGLARHPIYTGLLVGFAGTLLARGDLASVLGVTLLAVGIARKISIEEKLLGAHFGPEYTAYKQQVKAILPFIL